MFGGMPDSPRGREIKTVEGTPSGIIERGKEIERLGKMMDTSADTLRSIKENSFAGGQQEGKAIEKLQETIGESYKTLEEAADLYKPVGPVLVKYGEMLETYKPQIDSTARNCNDLWATYESLPGDKDDSTTEDDGGLLGIGDTDKEEAAENKAKKEAYEAWEDEAEQFDTWYGVWEDAFDEAVTGISDGLSGSIEDGFWDNWGDVIEVLTEILSWAALIVGVVALFCGGWIVALAVGLAIAAFLLTGIKYLNGKASGLELLLAGLAIFPVGKITSLTKFAQFPKLAKAGGMMNAISRTWKATGGGPLRELAKNYNKPIRLLTKSEIGEKLLGQGVKSIRKGNIGLYIGNRSALESGLGMVRNLSKVDSVASRVGAFSSHYGSVATAISSSGGVDISIPGPVGAFI
ncbi:hypothetical protein ACWZJV_16245 [Nocardioides sp. WG-D5]